MQHTVQVTLSALGDTAATLLLVVLDNADLLEGLEDLAVDGTAGIDVPGGADTPVLGSTVGPAETANTDGLAEVDVARNSGASDEPPVWVLGRQLVL